MVMENADLRTFQEIVNFLLWEQLKALYVKISFVH